ncbi:MAG: DUF4296 domain-containing protein [Flavobacteriales bacterium]|nr:DUF4296 domain-containing protein [Flavobacteriales bacterium]
MRQLAIFLCSFFVFLSSCQQGKKPETPAYLIDEDKMVHIMVDMHIVETASNLKVFPPDSAQQMYQNDFASIYLTHEVTKAAFDSNLQYYSTRTDQMNVIYDRILEELSEMESEVNANQ